MTARTTRNPDQPPGEATADVATPSAAAGPADPADPAERSSTGAALAVPLPAVPLPDPRLAAVAGAVVLALWPGRVPHGPLVTAVAGGVLGAVGWALASALVRCVRSVRDDDADAAQRCRSRGRLALALLGWFAFVGLAAEGIVLAHGADVRLAHSLQASEPTVGDHVLGALGAALVCAVLVTLPRTARVVRRIVRPA